MNDFERKMDRKLILSIIAAGMLSFTGVVVETSMNIAFPTLMNEFGVGTATVQWITTGYLLVLSIIIPTSSFLKKRIKIRLLFLSAVVFFLIGTLMCAFSISFPMLLVGRLIQGVGTGIALPLMFNIVLEQAPFEKMGFLMGVANMITAIAPAVGPSFGGWVITNFAWRKIFFFLIPLILAAFVIGVLVIRQTSELEKVSFDLKGYVCLAACFICFIFAINQAGLNGWGSFSSIGLFAAAGILFVIFILLEKRTYYPLLALSVFRYLPFSMGTVSLFIAFVLALGLGFLIPNYAQLVMQESALTAGLILVPGCLLGAVLTPFGGRLLDRVGPAKPILLGGCAFLLCMMLYMFSITSITVLVMALIYLLFPFGQAMAIGNTMTNGLGSLPGKLKSDGNAVYNICQQLSSAVGTAVVASVVAMAQQKYPMDLALGTLHGTQTAIFLLLISAVIFVICSFIAVKR